MKKFILLLVSIITLSSNAQVNYFVQVGGKSETYIRDLAILDKDDIVCGLDFNTEEKGSGIAVLDNNGSVKWGKEIIFSGSQRTHVFNVLCANESIYVHGLLQHEFNQYPFILKLDNHGTMLKSILFQLGSSAFHAINQIQQLEDGNFLCSFSHETGVSFVKLTPELDVVWSTTLDRTIYGTGKQPGYDFEIQENGDIIACGKSGYHFNVIKMDKRGQVLWSNDITIEDFSQAKTILTLSNGDLILTGDFLPKEGFTSFVMYLNGTDGTPVWTKKLDQFDGTFHYQQSELIGDEIHLTLMGNNNPSMNNPIFQNYYVIMNVSGEVLSAFRNGEKYIMADYQRTIRGDQGSIIFGSAYDENYKISGLIHAYPSHELDACYWTPIAVSTTEVTVPPNRYFRAEYTSSKMNRMDYAIELNPINITTTNSCEPVSDESTENEEFTAVEDQNYNDEEEIKSIIEEVENAIVAEREFIIYPNPNEGIFRIKTDYEIVHVFILDQAGRLLFEGDMEDGETVNLSEQPNGMYIMKILTDGNSLIRRVQINRNR